MNSFSKARNVAAFILIAVMMVLLGSNLLYQSPQKMMLFGQIPRSLYMTDWEYSVIWADNILKDHLTGRDSMTEVYSYLQVLMEKEEAGDFAAIKSKTGENSYGNFYPVVSEHIPGLAWRMKQLNDFCNEQGTAVVFWSALPLYTRGYSDYSAGLPAYDQNSDIDAMLYYLQGYGVDYLDSRAILNESEISPEEYRFKTDLHWTTQACYESFRALVNKMDAEYQTNLDPDNICTNPDQYNTIIYQDSFLGALGRQVGIPFSGIDDFTLMIPKFETNFTIETQGDDIYRIDTGSYAEVLLDQSYLASHSPYASAMYDVYLGGNSIYKRIVNQLNPDGPNVLLIYDSFSLPAATFLASAVGELHMICPLNIDGESNKIDITEYVKNNTFDLVIVGMYPGNYTDKAFSFFQE